ncbi:GUN4 domain-containing protein [Cyanobium sp. Morenito 9A2]|uniref:GUN4 domain-containing protein n=1 Tax=Cyanobium sp. Morenito 9A2 TaxID=2823718 RepID=UPI0020CD19CB|nr:GUN4 domain-containing protein [Cyanobium sp. Morenito 9A2]MCP9850503.1 GUN4 domain-containing protein [Cyanobium sp. Morenito 9A2]
MLSGPPVSSALSADQLLDQFLGASVRQRRGLLPSLIDRRQEWRPLVEERLRDCDPEGDDWGPGALIQLLLDDDDALSQAFLARHPVGWLRAPSGQGLDHGPLQRQLMQQHFEAADRMTSETLRRLAGAEAVRRGYVYYSEVEGISGTDLVSLDRLWSVYSRGRFGFSVQSRLLLAQGGRWERLWPRLGWKQEGVWTRYPSAFTWSIDAPEGHMPLINQLRGVRLMDALLAHPALKARVEG